MSLKSVFFEICRWAVVAAAIVCMIKMTGSSRTVSSADPERVLESVYSSVDTANLQPASHQIIKRLYGIDPSECAFCKLYYPMTNMDVDELLLIKYADSSQELQVQNAVAARLEGQKNAFENYGVGQMELLNNHSVFISDAGFAFFIVNSKADEASAAFADALRRE